MTLIEALIAITILVGVTATAIDTYRLAVMRSVISSMEAEAVALAETLLVRAGEDLPFQATKSAATDEGTLTWTVTSRPVGTSGKLQLLKTDSHVKIERGGTTIEQALSTLKLKQVSQK